MADRIYGAEDLVELGVQAPEIGALQTVEDFGLISEDVSLPDFLPDISETKGMDVGVRSRRRWFVFLTGFFGNTQNIVIISFLSSHLNWSTGKY